MSLLKLGISVLLALLLLPALKFQLSLLLRLALLDLLLPELFAAFLLLPILQLCFAFVFSLLCLPAFDFLAF